MRVLLKCMIGAALALTASPAWAQASYPTAAGNVRVQGVVPLQCDSSGANCTTAVNTYVAVRNAAGVSAHVAVPTDGSGVVNGLFVVAQNQSFNGSGWDRLKKPNAVNRLLSAAATTNSTLVKAVSGDLFQIDGQNLKAAPIYVKLYNKATAPSCGIDVPVATFYVAAGSHYNFRFDNPLYFSAGIGFCITGAAADADTTALVAGDVVTQNVVYG